MNYENMIRNATQEFDSSLVPETDTRMSQEDLELLKIMLSHQILAPLALEGSVALVEQGIPAVAKALNQ